MCCDDKKSESTNLGWYLAGAVLVVFGGLAIFSAAMTGGIELPDAESVIGFITWPLRMMK